MNNMSEMETAIRRLRVIVYSISDIPNWLIGTFNSAKEVALAVKLEKALTFKRS